MLKNLGVRAQAVNFQTLFRGLVRKRRCPAIFKKGGLTKLRKCDLTVCMTLSCQPQAESKVRSPEPRVTPHPGPLPSEGRGNPVTRHVSPVTGRGRPTYSSLFQPISSVSERASSLFQLIPGYSTVFQHIPAYSRIKKISLRHECHE